MHSKAIIECTTKLRSNPYDPSLWIERANHLISLGYPELAAGDAFRIKEWLQRNTDRVIGDPGNDNARIGRVAYKALFEALNRIGDRNGLWKICQDGKDFYSDVDAFRNLYEKCKIWAGRRAEYLETLCDGDNLHTHREHGVVMHWRYPFLPLRYQSRSTTLIDLTNTHFKSAASNCTLSQSPVLHSTNGESDVLGVFAARNLQFREPLLVGSTAFSASSISSYAPSTLENRPVAARVCENCYAEIPTGSDKVMKMDCCSTYYCSAFCIHAAATNYHRVVCGQDFDWLYREAAKKRSQFSDFVLNGPMWLRVLAICVQSGCHPLEHPSLARLTPLYDEKLRLWTIANNIETPLRILRQLGINIHTDMRYDSWVLQTIWARIINNQEEHNMDDGRPVRGINPFYSYFNHSCEANTEWKHPNEASCKGGSTKQIYVIHPRGIRKGGEIFINYGVEDGQSKETRHAMLAAWIGDNNSCGCQKCRRG